MKRRKLGRSELELPVVSLGTWAIGGWGWGGTDDDEAVRAIVAAIDHGIDAIDTAPVYGFGHSERIVGRALAKRRGRAIVMTKVGLRWDDQRGRFSFEARDARGEKRRVFRNSRPDSVRHEVQDSLARLGVEPIDLVQIHWNDPTTPIAETIGALLDLRREGKLRAIGVSNFSVAMMEEARAALGDVPLASDQPKYSLLARDIEGEIVPWARAHEVGLIVYSPLEQGLLTGKVGPERAFPADDGRSSRWTFSPENRARVNVMLDAVVRPIAERHAATIGQVAIAWTFSQPGITSAIVGARTEVQARENAAAGAIDLAATELAALRAAFERLALVSPPGAGLRARLARVLHGILGR